MDLKRNFNLSASTTVFKAKGSLPFAKDELYNPQIIITCLNSGAA